MQSELSSHVGMNGKHFCRVCHVRGKDKERSDNLEGEKKRLREFMTVSKLLDCIYSLTSCMPLDCTPGLPGRSVATLSAQLGEFMDKRFTAADELPTTTGVKDKYLSHFISTMKELYNSTTGSKRLTVVQSRSLLSNLRRQLPERSFNPALYLPGRYKSQIVFIYALIYMV